jgi:hypothetical protein
VIIQPLRHRLWPKVWAAMDQKKVPEDAAYALWAAGNDILPPSSVWMGPDGESCLPTTVLAEKRKALAPDECGEQETPLGENPWNAPYPDEDRRGAPNDWNHLGNFGCMSQWQRNQFNASVTNHQAHWTHPPRLPQIT